MIGIALIFIEEMCSSLMTFLSFHPVSMIIGQGHLLKPANALLWQVCGMFTRSLAQVVLPSSQPFNATAARWPPQVAPCSSILSHSNPVTATNFLNIIFPSPLYFMANIHRIWNISRSMFMWWKRCMKRTPKYGTTKKPHQGVWRLSLIYWLNL